MIGVEVEGWAAWAPGLEDETSWRSWCANPKELEREGKADVSFLPAMLRRRCGPLARIMLNAAFRCCDQERRGEAASVFASRHGNINESIEMLEHLTRQRNLSPTRFSHSVHNAQAGLFSIAASNRAPSSSLAAQDDTFAAAWLEAVILLSRVPERPCLLVIGEVPLAPAFAKLLDEPEASYALALLLRVGDGANALRLTLEAHPEVRRPARWPDALEFLRFLLSNDAHFQISTELRRTVWERRRK